MNRYYQFGGSLRANASTYIERKADEDFYNYLKAGEFCYVFTSRQMGKSSLRIRTRKRLEEEGIVCATVDLITFGGKSVPRNKWYKGIAQKLIKEFALSNVINFETWWQEREGLLPVQCLDEFIGEVLLAQRHENLVVFLDEIDTVLSLDFSVDEFFGLLRECYNKRTEKPEYNRLTFALLGVIAPNELIQDKKQPPFNIGKRIDLTGFTIEEAKPSLMPGLAGKFSEPEAVLKEVLDWTGGQPFLTQKLCNLVAQNSESKKPDIKQLVDTDIIQNWEAKDDPIHLRVIGNRLLRNEGLVNRLLGLYQQILQQGGIAIDESSEQTELQLSGLVVQRDGELKVYNPIYQEIFNTNWIDKELEKVRPYAKEIRAWKDSGYQDESRLLRGQELKNVLKWKADKSLGLLDEQFINASQELEKREVQRKLKKQLAFSIILGAFSIILGISLAFSLSLYLQLNSTNARLNLTNAKLKRLNGEAIEALMLAMQAGQEMESQVKDESSLKDLLLTLEQIFDNIREKNRLEEDHRDHRSEVNSVMFSPKGNLLATASGSTVRLWDLQGNKKLFKGHLNSIINSIINSVTFSPDGKWLATASRDGTARLWDLQGNEIQKFKGHQGAVYNVSFSPDGKWLATASRDGTARLWDLQGNEIQKFEGHQQEVYSVSFSPDGKWLATASRDETARLWDLQGNEIQKFEGHQGPVFSASFSPDGKWLATASRDGTARLWDLQGNEIQKFEGYQGNVNSISFSPNGQWLATASSDGKARIWDLDGKELGRVLKPSLELKGHDGAVYDVSFSPDGKWLATASNDGTARLWDLKTNPIPKIVQESQNIVDIISLSFKNDENLQVIARRNDDILRLWNLPGNQPAKNLRLWNLLESDSVELPRSKNSVYDYDVVRLSPNRQRVASLLNRKVKISDWHENKPGEFKESASKEFDIPEKVVYSINLTPDGQKLGAILSDGTLEIWDLQGKILHEFKMPNQKKIYSISFSSQTKLLATASTDGTVFLWDWNSPNKQPLKKLDLELSGKINAVRLSPDGEKLAAVLAEADNTVELWRLKGKPKLLEEFPSVQEVYNDVTFSPDGQQLAIVSRDHTVKVWRISVSASERLKQALNQGCNWLQDYLLTYPDEQGKLKVCSKHKRNLQQK